MASSAPSTPRRRASSQEIGYDTGTPGSLPRSGNRSRLNSNEIPRTYSGLYGAGAPPMPEFAGDNAENDGGGGGEGCSITSPPRLRPSSSLQKATPKSRARHGGQAYYQESNLLPFELSHNRNTDWIASGGPALLVTYVSIILVFLLTFLAFVPEPKMAWAMANVAHGLISMVYLHWIKGNPADYMDGTQGEMNAMTCWEQIVSKPSSHLRNAAKLATATESPVRGLQESATRAIRKLRSRDVLVVVPTLLAHASCHVAKYQFEYCAVNVGVWAVVMLPKMPFMNGVRILGINRTAGIDDGDYLEEDECFSTEEESSKDSAVGLEFDEGGSGTAEQKKDR